MKTANKKLENALKNLLSMAKSKLQYAIDRNKEWDIEHHKGDVEFLEKEIEIVAKLPIL